MSKSYKFENLAVSCSHCFPPINTQLTAHQQRLKIDRWHLDHLNKTATVFINDDNELSSELTENELRFILKDWLPAQDTPPQKHYHGWQAILGISLGFSMMMLMMLGIPLSPWLHDAIIYGGSLLTVMLGWPSYRKAFSSLTSKQKFFTMDTLFTISTLSAITISLLHVFFPIMSMMIDAALMILGFRHAGLWLEEKVTQKSLQQERFVDRGRHTIIQKKLGEHSVDCQLDEVGVGQIIKISAGQCIPLNGSLMQENAEITFALHTGQIEAVALKQGEKLYAGMIAQEDIIMKVSALEEDSYLRKRDLSLIESQMQKAPIHEFTQKITTWFVPGVLTAASLILLAGPLLGTSLVIKASLYLLVCACPCALGLITPLAINIGLTKTKDQGLVFNTAKGLQAAAEIDMAVFDLNGTLTLNKPQVVGTPTVPKDYFDIVYAMEAQSKHPISTGIKDHIGMPYDSIVFDKIENNNHGLMATLNGNVYKIGNASFFDNIPLPTPVDTGNAQHIIYFMKNGKIEGYFLLEDPIRPDASLMLENLIKNKFHIRILTGTNRATADRYAAQLRVSPDWIQTDCTPQSKSDHLQYFKNQKHKVAMFGDSGNDTEAIASADLGVAITSPATDPMTLQQADATLNNHSLMPILQLFAVGRQTMRQIKQNLWISFGYNILSLGFVACAIFLFPTVLNPAFGAALMTFQSACILANAYRIKHQETTLPVFIKQQAVGLQDSSMQMPDQEGRCLFFSPSSSLSKSPREPSELMDDRLKNDERRESTLSAEVDAGIPVCSGNSCSVCGIL